MAHPNFFERQSKVHELCKQGKISSLRKQLLALEFNCSVSAIDANIISFNKGNNDCTYPNKAIKNSVFKRDNNICQYCENETLNPVAEHVIPTIIGGTGKHYNIVCACQSCNMKKKGGKVWIPINFNVLKELNPKWAQMILDKAVADFRKPYKI